MQDVKEQVEQGLQKAFIDTTISSIPDYEPQFLTNDRKTGIKVLTTIESELQRCQSFSISVAFITLGGIEPLLQTLKELENRNIHGRILTTDYLMFSDPKALKKLAQFHNIDLRMYRCQGSSQGFHTKGYMFKENGVYRFIIGSSNMTQAALTTNKEWNTKLVAFEQGEFSQYLLQEFDHLFYSDYAQTYDAFIDAYDIAYKPIQNQRKIAKRASQPSVKQYQLKPNQMQIAVIQNLIQFRKKKKHRALLISATGTGKTYASAFAMRETHQNKVLFLVHREQIAKQALKSYQNVFGSMHTFGLLSGNTKEIAADYLFATMQMMSKDEIMHQFVPTQFDTIIIDEAHRIGSKSYLKIMNYFKPDFWLGMSASPERMDTFDVYEVFDHNIVYEIRLQQALEEDLLCPFHYFGITDLEINGQTIDDKSTFNQLSSDERVQYIIKQAEYYGYSGNRVKGLIFCSRKEEAMAISIGMNRHGYHTMALTGQDPQAKREECIDRLVNDNREDRLDYLITVDIFNEGVDIPEINQVILLRPTQSPIVFVQQLGRGLRKDKGKEFVVILEINTQRLIQFSDCLAARKSRGCKLILEGAFHRQRVQSNKSRENGLVSK